MIASEEEARAFVAARGDGRSMERLDRLADALRIENKAQNLVSPATLDKVWSRHICDSAQLVDHAVNPRNWLDLGTGAGFPGLVVAILRPDLPVTLVESRRLRIEWLQRMAVELELERCSVVGLRLESVETAPFSVISARAFAPLTRLVGMARRFSTGDTVWLLPKGRSAAQEVADLPKGTRGMFHVEPSVTDPKAGIVVGRLQEEKHP